VKIQRRINNALAFFSLSLGLSLGVHLAIGEEGWKQGTSESEIESQSPNQVQAQSITSPMKEEEFGYPTMAGGQGQENNDQSQSSLINAPGTDPTVYVPGSTATASSQAEFYRIGSILFRPSARVGYSYESNLLNLSNSRFADHSWYAEPSLEAFIPVTSHGLRLDYTLGYRDYRYYPLRHKIYHTFNADSQFDITQTISFAVRDHFAISSLNSREFVPGREVLFSDARFKRNQAEGQFNWQFSENDALGITGSYNRVLFDTPEPDAIISSDTGKFDNSLPFYDYDTYTAGGFYKRDVSRRTALFVDGQYERLETEDPRGIADSRGGEAVIGIESLLTPLISGQFSAGFRSNEYPGAPLQDFLGSIFRASLQKEFTESIRVSVAGSRDTNPSAFQDNTYYLTHGIGVAYSQDVGSKFFFSISPSYQRNSYPLPIIPGEGVPNYLISSGQHRIDRLYEISVDARYRFSDLLAVDFLFDGLRRESVLPGFEFTDYRVGVSLLLGRSAVNRGRLPY
jgi:hypothetical protein